MIISNEKKFIFFAFNKTGSTSVEQVLSKENSKLISGYLWLNYKLLLSGKRHFKHVDPRDIKQILGARRWDNYFKFTFVRNPWSRAVSLYNYHRKSDPARFPLAQKSFKEWVLGGGTGTANRSMSDFIRDDNGALILDFVGRYETLQQDFSYICKEIGLPDSLLPHANQSTREDYRKYYDDETREIVRNWCSTDIAEFDYRFWEDQSRNTELPSGLPKQGDQFLDAS